MRTILCCDSVFSQPLLVRRLGVYAFRPIFWIQWPTGCFSVEELEEWVNSRYTSYLSAIGSFTVSVISDGSVLAYFLFTEVD